MGKRRGNNPNRSVATIVWRKIERGGDRLWRLEDFGDLSFYGVAHALSRLAKAGHIERLSKGVYYRPRPTRFGKSRPKPSALQDLVSAKKPLFPSGQAAASHLGLTTQVPARREVATSAGSLPRKLLEGGTVVRVRRPAAWRDLSETDAAVLEVLRHPIQATEPEPENVVRGLLSVLRERGRLSRLLGVADSEPPRVRALLGALAEQLGSHERSLVRLRGTLNPSSRFEFGVFSILPNARAWQAKGGRR